MESSLPGPVAVRGAVTADFDGMWRLYRASLRHCWLPAALLVLVWAALFALLLAQLNAQDDLLRLIAQLEALVSGPVFWRALLAAGCVSTWLFCAVVAIVHAVAAGAAPGVGSALARALRAFPAALAAAAIYLVLTSLGSMLLLLPGAYLWGIWQLWVVVLMAEQCGPLAALGRSAMLVRGAWWRATTLTTVATIIAIAAPLACNVVVAVLGAVAGLGAAQMNWISLFVLGGSAVLAVPLLPAALVAAYVEQRRLQQRSA